MSEDPVLKLDCRMSLRALLDLLNACAADYLEAWAAVSLLVTAGPPSAEPKPEPKPRKVRRGWNPEEKAAAVTLANEIGITAAARKVVASESMVRRWKVAADQAIAEAAEDETAAEETAEEEVDRIRLLHAVAAPTPAATSAFVPSGVKQRVDHERLRRAAFADDFLDLQ